MKGNSSIKEKIFEIRRKKDISQEKMAQMLDISTNSYRKMEKGRTSLINDRLWDIARILEVSLEELMLDEDFTSGMSLADIERERFMAEIESLRNEILLLKQHINHLADKYEGYVKKAR